MQIPSLSRCKSRRPGASPPLIEIRSLLPLVVPVPTFSAASETFPDERLRPPSMRQLSKAMWCHEEAESETDEDELESNNSVRTFVKTYMIVMVELRR